MRARARGFEGGIIAAALLICSTLSALATPVGASLVLASAPTVSVPSAYLPVTPCRLFDSRNGGERLSPSRTERVPTAERCGVPPGATAVAVSVTVTLAEARGFVTVWPGDAAQPLASTINFERGDTRANGSLVALGTDGSLGVASNVPAHVIVDVTGVFVAADGGATAGRFVPLDATRLLDTRHEGVRLAPGATVTIPLPDAVPADATAVSLTIATTDSRSAGFLTAYPQGTARPPTSTLNTDGPGQTRAAGQIVPVGPGGIDVYSQTGEHIVVDLNGWFTGPSAPWSTDGLFIATTPRRLVDTRGTTPVYPDGTIPLDPTPFTSGPVAAVAANWTLTGTWSSGYLTAYPARRDRPSTSTVNADRRHQDVAAFGIVATSTGGIEAFSNAGTHLAVDVTGWFTGVPAAATSATTPPNRPVADIGKRVLLMGDSTLAGVRWYTNSQHALGGSTFLLDAESCRRLVGSSCRGREARVPPNAVSAISAAEGTFDVVVVMTGYNDWYTTFPSAIELVMAAARSKGARQVVWLTYREGVRYTNPSTGSSQAYGYRMQNQLLREAAASGRYPDLVVADWNSYTASRSDWFVADGVHFTIRGAYGAADYVARTAAMLYGEPCPAAWVPGGGIDTPCPSPDTRPDVVDPLALYAGNPSDIHCYLVGPTRRVECRPDPKLGH